MKKADIQSQMTDLYDFGPITKILALHSHTWVSVQHFIADVFGQLFNCGFNSAHNSSSAQYIRSVQ